MKINKRKGVLALVVLVFCLVLYVIGNDSYRLTEGYVFTYKEEYTGLDYDIHDTTHHPGYLYCWRTGLVTTCVHDIYYRKDIIVAKQDSLSFPTYYVVLPDGTPTLTWALDDIVIGPVQADSLQAILSARNLSLKSLHHRRFFKLPINIPPRRTYHKNESLSENGSMDE